MLMLERSVRPPGGTGDQLSVPPLTSVAAGTVAFSVAEA